MLITLANADFSNTRVGQVARTVQGAPAQTLLGLWLFMDGSEGDALTQITDLSGNGNHATLKAGWPPVLGQEKRRGRSNRNALCHSSARIGCPDPA